MYAITQEKQAFTKVSKVKTVSVYISSKRIIKIVNM